MAAQPLVNFHFQVEWGGTRLGFTEVSGLEFETEVIEYRDGMNPDFSLSKMPGMKKYGNITLKRGMFQGDNELFDWWQSVHGADFRRDVTISLLNEEHEPTVVWKLTNAWPVSVKISEMNASKSAIAIESLELVCDRIAMENN